MKPRPQADTDRLWRRARALAWLTLIYNLVEGLVSVGFGVTDEALALLGFGLDSFIEAISALGILAMVRRIRERGEGERSAFEVRALRITGGCFLALAAALGVGALIVAGTGRGPESTLAGAIISGISVTSMLLLVVAKRSVGRALGSEPLLADANCSLVCVWMSLVVLASSALYEWLRIGYIDALGATGLVWFSIREGREALSAARDLDGCGCG